YAFSIENYEGRILQFVYGPDVNYVDGDMAIMQNGRWTYLANDIKFIAKFGNVASIRGIGADALYTLLKNNAAGTRSLVQIKTKSGQWADTILTSRGVFSEAPDFSSLEVGTGVPLLTFVYPLVKGKSNVVDGTGQATIRIVLDYTQLVSPIFSRPGITGYRAYFSANQVLVHDLSNERTSTTVTSTASIDVSVTVPGVALKDLDSIALDVTGSDMISIIDGNGEALASSIDIPAFGSVNLASGQLRVISLGHSTVISPKQGVICNAVSELNFKSGFGNFLVPVVGVPGSYTLRAAISSTIEVTSTRAMPVNMHHAFQVTNINIIVQSSEFESHEVSERRNVAHVQIVDLNSDARPDILLDSAMWARSEGTDRVYKIKIQAHLADQPREVCGDNYITLNVFVSAQAPRPKLLLDTGKAFDQCAEFTGTPSAPAQFVVKLPASSGSVVQKVVEFDMWLFRDASTPAGIIIKLLSRFNAVLFGLSFRTSTSSTKVSVYDLQNAPTGLEFDPETWTHVRIHLLSPTMAEVWTGVDSKHLGLAYATLPCFASIDSSGIWSVGITSTTTSRIDNIACSWSPSIIDFT
nr:hypothetical protein [Candidatus Sigynarchaeota archaeon]